MIFFFFFFNDTATTEIYTLSLHDALPIWLSRGAATHNPLVPGSNPGGPIEHCTAPRKPHGYAGRACRGCPSCPWRDRKSTRLNSSHLVISYAVFCLKKKKHTQTLNAHSLD